MGTPEFAVPSLESICRDGHEVVGVVTAPDKPQGRGQRIRSSAIKQAAEKLGISRILQPVSVKDPAFARDVAALQADVIVVVAFRILPPAVYSAARLGAFNLHGSLLPKYRGAAPIHHAVLNGDAESGVTTFFLQQKVDTGNVILRKSLPIGENETTGDVYERMMLLGADAVVETLRLIQNDGVHVEPQDDSLATPAPKVQTADAVVNWDSDALSVHNHIRGYSPIPGAWSKFRSSRVKFFRSSVTDESAGGNVPGTILSGDDHLFVQCGPGTVRIVELQVEGKKRMSGTDFLRGYRPEPGEVFSA